MNLPCYIQENACLDPVNTEIVQTFVIKCFQDHGRIQTWIVKKSKRFF